MEGLYRALYLLAWIGLPLGVGLQLLARPPRGWEGWAYPLFGLLFLAALKRGPKGAPRLLVHVLGCYFLFEMARAREAW